MVETTTKQVVEQKEVIEEVICNMCGKKIDYLQEPEELKGVRSDYCHIEKTWDDYISKDNFHYDEFDLCEDCYNSIIENFKVPVYRHEY